MTSENELDSFSNMPALEKLKLAKAVHETKLSNNDTEYRRGFVNAINLAIHIVENSAEQEPVAVISESAIGLVKLHSNGACLPFGTQLYAAPVSAKREFVDLTDDAIAILIHRIPNKFEFGRAIIAAFKEKNE